ncbi:MAG: HEPN domain-containing protein [Armatimonadota bacterium]|nr:HEPN domain-containing protein [Armatimonadota bacterium]MDR5703135.1 HEPN domain-containing protein [Armatimonadota bacterium]
MTNREAGERLVREARRIFKRELQAAWAERDFNLVVRRAQEVVELSLKGALRILGVDFPKVHDVAPVFVEQVRRKRGQISEEILIEIQRISSWLSEARAPAFYLERIYGEADARRALSEAEFILNEIQKAFAIEE